MWGGNRRPSRCGHLSSSSSPTDGICHGLADDGLPTRSKAIWYLESMSERFWPMHHAAWCSVVGPMLHGAKARAHAIESGPSSTYGYYS